MTAGQESPVAPGEWKTIEVAGGRLAYEVVGSGSPILFIHSVIADGRMWDRAVARFSDRHRVVRFDLRGFGRSPPATSAFSYSEDIRALVEALKLDRPLLVGSSMGGALAIDFALAQPTLVGGLFLVAPGIPGGFPPPYSVEEQQALAEDERLSKEIDEAWSRGDRGRALEGLRRLWCVALEGPALALFRRMVEENLEEVFGNRSMKLANDLIPADPRLGEIRVPTTVLIGDRDNPFSPVIARRVARSIPGARFVTVPGADHLINLSRPEAFERELRAAVGESG